MTATYRVVTRTVTAREYLIEAEDERSAVDQVIGAADAPPLFANREWSVTDDEIVESGEYHEDQS